MKSHHAYQIAHMKAAIVEQILAGKLSATEASRSLKKSRVAIYEWMTLFKEGGIDALLPRKTGPKKGTRAWNRSSEETEAAVLKMMHQHPDWNIYEIAKRLPKEHAVYPSTVFRIWERSQKKQQNIRLPRPKPQLYVKEDVGEEIQMDTSYPWGRSSHRVCFDCLDDRSRFAFARLYQDATQHSSVSFLHFVIAHAPFVIRSIRTDCGREWGTEFTLACEKAGIRHIKNEPYHPEHNGKIEKFHDSLKHRCFYIYLHPYDSLAQQNSDLQQWLVWYNYYKMHFGLGMEKKTPAEVVYQSLVSKSSCVNLMLQPNTS